MSLGKKKTGHGERFSRLQEKALASLISAPTFLVAAKEVGVSPRTLQRWMEEPRFKARLRSMKTEILSSATCQLRNLCLGAVAVLASIAKNPNAPAGARVRAAAVILENAFKAEEIESLSSRLEELERATEREAAR